MRLNIFQAVAESLAELVPTGRKSRVALKHETGNVSGTATVSTVQGAIRAAEGGETRQLFALYRDLTAGGSHIQAEMNKRKLAMLAQPMAVLPFNKTNKDDLAAAAACEQMVQRCENWNDAITHLLDSCMWPVAVGEKVYKAAETAGASVVDQLGGASVKNGTVPAVRFWLARIVPVNPQVLCFKKPSAWKESQGDQVWEPDVRFYPTDDDGRISYVAEQSYAADPARHVIHRGHLLVGLRDTWGGPMRAAVFWWLLASLGRDWFARAMERYGVPFPVGHTDGKDPQAVSFLQEAFSLATKIGGLVVDHETQVELKEIALSGTADAHEKWLATCNREISKLIVGQTLSSEAQSTGLGSSVGDLHSEVREDIRQFDQIKMGETVRKQIFEPWLRINGIKGNAPKPVWGGLSDEDAKLFAETLNILRQAGFEPTEEALSTVSERVGFPVQRVGSDLTKSAETLTFKREVFKQWMQDGTVSGVLANQTDLKRLTEDVALPVNEDYVDPYLPVKTEDGAEVTGEVVKDSEGDIVGGTTGGETPKERNTETPSARGGAEGAEGEDGSRKDAKTPRGEEKEDERGSARISGFHARLRLLSAQGKMADSLGVPPAWLNPVREFLEELQTKAADRSLSEADLLDFLEEGIKRVPELFAKMEVDDLAKVLEAGMGEAVMDEVRRGLRKGPQMAQMSADVKK